MKPLFVDFETRSAVDLTKAGAHAYAEDPSTEILCVGWALGDGPAQVSSPQRFFQMMQTMHYDVLVAHNAPFEMAIWNGCAFFKYGASPITPKSFQCTMAMCHAMALPGALADAAPALGIAIQKDAAGHRIMLKLSQPRSKDADGNPTWWTYADKPDDWKKLIDYCRQDIEVERALYARLLALSPAEQNVWALDCEINRRGVQIDLSAVQAAITLVEGEKEYANREIKWLTDNAVATVTAVGQLTEWLNLHGMNCGGVTKADVIEMLGKPNLPTVVRQVLLLRQENAKSSTAKLAAMAAGACKDGRLKGMFQYCGAGQTGRWAGRRIQLHNMIRNGFSVEETAELFEVLAKVTPKTLKSSRDLIELLHGSPTTAISRATRNFLIAKEGHDLIAGDLGQIEARMVAWLSGQERILKVFAEDGPIYEMTASEIYGREITKKDQEERQIGKVSVLAFGFGGGVGALQTMCKAYNVQMAPALKALLARATLDQVGQSDNSYTRNKNKYDITRDEFVASDLTKQLWRQANPEIVGYWDDLGNAALQAVLNPGAQFSAGVRGREIQYRTNGSFLWCRLPSGRTICYPYPEIKPTKTPWGAMKDQLTYMTMDSTTHRWVRVSAYGGTLCGHVTQGSARDLLASALLALENAGYPIVLHVHDEAVAEIPKDFGSVSEFETIMKTPPAWAEGLPMSCKGWRGPRYRKD